MNNEETSGFKKVVDAALSEIPRFLTSIVVAIAVFQFGLWVDVRDLKVNLADCRNDVCERVQKCPNEKFIQEKLNNLAQFDNKIETDYYSFIKDNQGWQARIIQLEDRMYNAKTRFDYYSQSDGNGLEHRIDELEKKIDPQRR